MGKERFPSTGLPERAFVAYLQDNTELPQTNPRVVLLTGAALSNIYIGEPQGQGMWNKPAPGLNSDQLGRTIKAMNAWHKFAKVDCNTTHNYVIPRMHNIVTPSIKVTRKVVVDYARSMMPDQFNPRENPEATTGRILYAGEPAPEAFALNGLWVAASEGLLSREGQAITGPYKAEVSSLKGPALNRPRAEVLRTLSPVINNAILEALPGIQAATGVVIPEAVVDGFMRSNNLFDAQGLASLPPAC